MWENDLRRIAAQQRAQRLAQAQAQEIERLRVESLNRSAAQLKSPTEWQLALKGKADEAAPIPDEVVAQLDYTRGRLGHWLSATYSEVQLEHWRNVWLRTTVVGGEVLAEIEAEAERREQAALAVELVERQRQLKREAEIAHQEGWRLPDGTVVRIVMPRTQLEGRIGRVHSMQMVGHRLMASVLVESGVPGTGRRGISVIHQIPAEQLVREHPEAMG
jgi:hypothetical protein